MQPEDGASPALALAERLRRVFSTVAAICVAFVLLTVTAMFLYPGGSVADRQGRSYSFFTNFFSDLGQTRTHSGQSNLSAMVLFLVAMTTVAIGLALFFMAFTRLVTSSGGPPWIGRVAAACGIVTGICFIGVAATPWNLYLAAHIQFVLWAFRSLLAAVLLYVAAILRAPRVPLRFAWVFATSGALLVAYIVLLTIGPSPGTPEGSLVQATGQKIIVYASILTVLVQALGERALLRGAARAH